MHIGKPAHVKQAIGMTLLLAVLVMGAVLLIAFIRQQPSVVDTSLNEASIYLSANRSWTFFPNDCITLSWDVEHIQAIYLNKEGRTGTGKEQYCGSNARFRIQLPDGTEHTYRLAVKAWIKSRLNQIVLLIASGMVGAAFFLLGWLPGVAQWRSDLKTLGRDVRRFGHILLAEDKNRLGVLLLIGVVGFGLRGKFADHELWVTEAETFNHYAGRPLEDALSTYNDPNNHLLNTALMHVTHYTFGRDVWLLRLPALIAGLLCIPAGYVVARLYYNRDAALLAGALLATAWYLMMMSVNARGYSIQALLFLLLLITAYYLDRRENCVVWLGFAIVTALGFYTLPTSLYYFAGIFIWLLGSFLLFHRPMLPRVRSLFVFSVLAAWLTLVLYSPIIVRQGFNLLINNRWVQPVGWDVFPRLFKESMERLWHEWNTATPGVLAIVLLVGSSAALVLHKRVARHRLPVVLPLLAAPAVIVPIQNAVPFVRVWTYGLALYLILAAAGLVGALQPIGRRWKQSVPMVAVGLLVVLALFAAQPHRSLNNELSYRDVYPQVNTEIQNGASLFCYYPVNEIMIYYFYLNGADLRSFDGSLDSNQPLVVVVETPRQSLEWVLNRVAGARLISDSPPQPIVTSGGVEVYRINSDQLRTD